MKLGMRLLLFALFVTAALAASKCGKTTYKSKYGRQSNFRSVAGMKATCKYRIRSAPGFHVKLILENYNPDPCCLEVSISPKQKGKGKKAQAIEIPPGPRATFVVNASDIIVVVKTSVEAQAVVVNYEAVLPADGNFGFSFRAKRKPKPLRSPNFPKIKLPSGVRSVWNVTSGRGETIRIDITGLSTTDDRDTLQIFDGPTSVATLSGRKKKRQLPITKYASSGSMTIILETQTALSKGFRAKVAAVESDGGDIEIADVISDNESLQCHKRLRMLSQGRVISDETDQMTCGDGEICGTMIIEGLAIVQGSPLPIITETMHCIPRSLCEKDCARMPQPKDRPITASSCNMTCCDTDLCNTLPDGPVTPATSLPPSWPRPGYANRCYNIQQAQMPSGQYVTNMTSESTCGPDSVCMRGQATVTISGMDVSVVYGSCVPKLACGSLSCDTVAGMFPGEVTARDCNIQCCEIDLCNAEPLSADAPTSPSTIVTPSIAASAGDVRQCYNIFKADMVGSSLLNQKSARSCEPGSVCLRVEATTKRPGFENTIAVTYGACYPKIACSAANSNCGLVTQNVPGVTIKECQAQCCATELCNETPLSEMSVPATPLNPSLPSSVSPGNSGGVGVPETSECYNIFQVKSYGIKLPNTKRVIMSCQPDSQCIKILAVSSNPAYSGITVKTTVGYCVPRATCSSLDCSSLPQAPGMTERTCISKCCDGDLCNG